MPYNFLLPLKVKFWTAFQPVMARHLNLFPWIESQGKCSLSFVASSSILFINQLNQNFFSYPFQDNQALQSGSEHAVHYWFPSNQHRSRKPDSQELRTHGLPVLRGCKINSVHFHPIDINAKILCWVRSEGATAESATIFIKLQLNAC